eukprot:Seg1408.7 transcript_id=Seg1408.7/GoldUCD/mRNA.D3Y31 product="Ammonium transporter Rh type A" protein_id=Seg1408.7/GoldUCD/D3Y31
MITADFNAGAVLISFGAIIGKASRLQLIVMAIIESVIYAVNELILVHYIKVTDIGGSMIIHMFGAYFGLAVALVLRRTELQEEENSKEGSTPTSDLFSMLGTVFLWLFWPSFNGAMLGPGDQQSRAFVNTYISLAAACVGTFIFSPLVHGKHKLNMVHVQNATLAGGVAVGAVANLIIKPWGAMLIGLISGALCTLGYQYVTGNQLSSLSFRCIYHLDAAWLLRCCGNKMRRTAPERKIPPPQHRGSYAASKR